MDGVDSGDSQHICTRHHPWALLLQLRLDLVDDVEVAQAEVDGGILLRHTTPAGVQQDGAITTLHKAVVEE